MEWFIQISKEGLVLMTPWDIRKNGVTNGR